MHRKVWVFQHRKEVEEKGNDASWYVGFYDIAGKRRKESCGPGREGRKKVERRSRQLEGQLEAGTYRPIQRITWQEFRQEWEAKILTPKRKESTRSNYKRGLNQFERIVKPGRLATVTRQTIDEFIAARMSEHTRSRDADGNPRPISPATVNRDLRAIKVFLRTAYDWELLSRVPRIRMVKEPQREIRKIPAEYFAAIFNAAADAHYPRHQGQNYSPGEWWQALLATAYMTGMCRGELLALQWPDLDLEACEYTTRAEDNKAERDETLPLHPAVVEHLLRIRGFNKFVFPWEYSERTLYGEFHRIQRAADITGRPYGFHDLRRSFGSIQATRVQAAVLKRLMRHSSVATTLKFYTNVDGELRTAIDSTPVPPIFRIAT